MAWKQENELFDVVAKRKQKIENRREKMLVMYLCCCSDGKSNHVQFIIICFFVISGESWVRDQKTGPSTLCQHIVAVFRQSQEFNTNTNTNKVQDPIFFVLKPNKTTQAPSRSKSIFFIFLLKMQMYHSNCIWV